MKLSLFKQTKMIDYASKLEAVEAEIKAHKAKRLVLLGKEEGTLTRPELAELADYKEELAKLEEDKAYWKELVKEEQKAATSGKCWVV